jgi:hypothetical protein
MIRQPKIQFRAGLFFKLISNDNIPVIHFYLERKQFL